MYDWNLIDHDGNRQLAKNRAYLNFKNLSQVVFRDEHNRSGLLNGLTDEVILEPKYVNLFPPSDGVCVASNEEGFGLIDLRGTQICQMTFERIASFIDGFAVADHNNKSGLISADGTWVIDPVFRCLKNLGEGLVAASKDTAYAYFNTIGVQLTDYTFSDPGVFREGLALVKSPSFTGVIDRSINLVAASDGWYDGFFFSDGLAKVYVDRKTAEVSFIDRKGVISAGVYDDAGNFNEDICPVKIDGQYSLIDRNGDIVFESQLDEISNYSDGLCAATRLGKRGFIESDGRVRVPFVYDVATSFRSGYAAVARLRKE